MEMKQLKEYSHMITFVIVLAAIVVLSIGDEAVKAAEGTLPKANQIGGNAGAGRVLITPDGISPWWIDYSALTTACCDLQETYDASASTVKNITINDGTLNLIGDGGIYDNLLAGYLASELAFYLYVDATSNSLSLLIPGDDTRTGFESGSGADGGFLFLRDEVGDMQTQLSVDGLAVFNVDQKAAGDFKLYSENQGSTPMIFGDSSADAVSIVGTEFAVTASMMYDDGLAAPLTDAYVYRETTDGYLHYVAIPDYYYFKTITPSSGTAIVADAADDSMTLTAGAGITTTGTAATDDITIACTITQYTDELAEDAIGGILTDTSTINLTYDDGANTITAATIGCRCRAYASAAQNNITNNTYTKVVLGTESWDSGAYFATSAFTPLVAGYYQVNAQVAWTGHIASKLYRTAIYVNGAAVIISGMSVGSDLQEESINAQGVVYLDGINDYVELYCYNYSGANTCDIKTGTEWTFMDCSLIM